ncbi:MAG: hypothetical protein LW832_06615 [Parachlamydia sp.]|jgi:hypothetical protein|nr:hypothetical protein [Parachlamydia sp.]
MSWDAKDADEKFKDLSARGITTIAKQIQSHCVEKELVDKKRNGNGHCNPFKPHMTLGQVTSQEDCKTLHHRVSHSQEKQLSHLVSTQAGKAFSCQKNHRSCNALPLEFERIEILRCDSKEGEAGQTTCLASYDIQSKQANILPQFPGCLHVKNKP